MASFGQQVSQVFTHINPYLWLNIGTNFSGGSPVGNAGVPGHTEFPSHIRQATVTEYVPMRRDLPERSLNQASDFVKNQSLVL